MGDEFDFIAGLSFQMNGEGGGSQTGRQRVRVAVNGVQILVHEKSEAFAVNNISAGGVCIASPSGRFAKGESLTADILIEGHPYLNDLEALVLRVGDADCACSFPNLTRHQELKLDKLVLETQKSLIARRRKEREAMEAAAEQSEDKEISLRLS